MRLEKYVFYTILYVVTCYICDFGISELYCSIYSETTIIELQNFHALRYNVALVSKLCNFSILLVISGKEKESEEIPLSNGNLYILLVTIAITFISLYGLDKLIRFSIEWTTNPKIDIIMCILSISIFSINMIVYWTIKQLNKSVQKEKEYTLIQYQNELLIKSAEENQALENEWHRIRHDFNNHISCIDMLLQVGNIERARSYIQKLTQNSQPQVVSVHIGNDIADAVVNQKIIRAKNYDIAMEVEGKLPIQLQVDDVDLCALLSNSLDNAIEAACQIEKIDERMIKLEITEDVQCARIQVSNSVKADILPQEHLKTTKKDKKRHGIGMRSMQASVARYKGKMDWHCEGGVFTLSIMLPI